MGVCCEKKTLIGWRNVWNMRWKAPNEEVDQRGHGKKLSRMIAKHIIWMGRMVWIIVDWMMIRMVGGWMFLLLPAHPGSPGQRAVKRLLLLQFDSVMCGLPGSWQFWHWPGWWLTDGLIRVTAAESGHCCVVFNVVHCCWSHVTTSCIAAFNIYAVSMVTGYHERPVGQHRLWRW